MSRSTAEFHPEDLLRHAHWVKKLARRLAGDEAEDLEQQIWLAAIEKPPRQVRNPGAWLSGVTRNLALRARRDHRQRLEHRANLVSLETAPSASEIVERGEALRRVANAVMDLREPYRSVVLLRFFEELSPREISKRLKLPGGTVRSHLARGLEQLRHRLRDEHGPDWRVSCLGPLLKPLLTNLSIPTMKLAITPLKATAALAVVLGGASLSAWSLGLLPGQDPAPSADPAAAEQAQAPAALSASLEQELNASGRQPLVEENQAGVATAENGGRPAGARKIQVLWGPHGMPAKNAIIEVLDEETGTWSRLGFEHSVSYGEFKEKELAMDAAAWQGTFETAEEPPDQGVEVETALEGLGYVGDVWGRRNNALMTDSEGEVDVKLPPGTRWVRAAWESELSWYSEQRDVTKLATDFSLKLTKYEMDPERPAVALAGVVVRTDKRPLPWGLAARVKSEGDARLTHEFMVNAEGGFLVPSVPHDPAGGSWTVIAAAGNGLQGSLRLTPPEVGKLHEGHTVVLDSSHLAFGRVLARESREGLENALVRLSSRHEGFYDSDEHSTRTTTEGRFEIALDRHQPAALLSVEVVGYAPLALATERLQGFKPGDQIELVLDPTASVHGTVLDEHGQPLEGDTEVIYERRGERASNLQTRFYRQTVYADADGHFRLDGLAAGPGRLFVSRDLDNGRYLEASTDIELTAGEEREQTLQIGTPKSLRGRVTTAGASDWGVLLTDDHIHQLAFVRADDQGSFELQTDYAGPVLLLGYRLDDEEDLTSLSYALYSGPLSAPATGIELTPLNTEVRIEIPSDASGRSFQASLRLDPARMPGSWQRLFRTIDRGVPFYGLGRGQASAIRGLPPGTYEVTVAQGKQWIGTKSVRVVAGQPAVVKLEELSQ